MTVKLIENHPTFTRLRAAVDAETAVFRARILAMLSREGVLSPGPAADRAAHAFRRRFEKQFGLTGRYVAHNQRRLRRAA